MRDQEICFICLGPYNNSNFQSGL